MTYSGALTSEGAERSHEKPTMGMTIDDAAWRLFDDAVAPYASSRGATVMTPAMTAATTTPVMRSGDKSGVVKPPSRGRYRERIVFEWGQRS